MKPTGQRHPRLLSSICTSNSSTPYPCPTDDLNSLCFCPNAPGMRCFGTLWARSGRNRCLSCQRNCGPLVISSLSILVPVHPFRRFLATVAEAAKPAAAHDMEQGLYRYTLESLRLQILEEVMLEFLVKTNSGGEDALHRDIRRYDAVAKRLAVSVSDGAQRLSLRSHDEELRQISGTVAVIFCALMDAELAGFRRRDDWSHGNVHTVENLNVRVDGFAMTPNVMCELFIHQLRTQEDPAQALGAFLQVLLSAAGDHYADILRVMLILERGVGRSGPLSSLWKSLVSNLGCYSLDIDQLATRLAASQVGDSPGSSSGGGCNFADSAEASDSSSSSMWDGPGSSVVSKVSSCDNTTEQKDFLREHHASIIACGTPNTDLRTLVSNVWSLVAPDFPPEWKQRDVFTQLDRLGKVTKCAWPSSVAASNFTWLAVVFSHSLLSQSPDLLTLF